MGSEGVQEIMGGHFGKYGIRRGTGNNGRALWEIWDQKGYGK